MESIIEVYIAENEMAASLAKGAFENEGVRASVGSSNQTVGLSSGQRSMMGSNRPWSVSVFEKDKDQAISILKEINLIK